MEKASECGIKSMGLEPYNMGSDPQSDTQPVSVRRYLGKRLQLGGSQLQNGDIIVPVRGQEFVSPPESVCRSTNSQCDGMGGGAFGR